MFPKQYKKKNIKRKLVYLLIINMVLRFLFVTSENHKAPTVNTSRVTWPQSSSAIGEYFSILSLCASVITIIAIVEGDGHVHIRDHRKVRAKVSHSCLPLVDLKEEVYWQYSKVVCLNVLGRYKALHTLWSSCLWRSLGLNSRKV